MNIRKTIGMRAHTNAVRMDTCMKKGMPMTMITKIRTATSMYITTHMSMVTLK